ncbi:MAG TPA: HNH endonuclease signature motif containing protein, partial [Candidatus Dormibacteraeota bacterium]|nr:HNH endonuclease signature motif containing protein [Candidatus Dormibacteraeota bacterium]
TLRRLGCDATIKTMIERGGVTIAEGRETPTVPPRMKRAARSRDGICGYPGCAVPATECEAHHLHHWYDGGPTVLWNILSVCESHHDAHHRGEFHIRRTPAGDLEFQKANGEVFGTLTGGHWKRPKDRAGP